MDGNKRCPLIIFDDSGKCPPSGPHEYIVIMKIFLVQITEKNLHIRAVTEENSTHCRRDRSAQMSFFLQYRNLNRFYNRYTHPAILKLLKNTQCFENSTDNM